MESTSASYPAHRRRTWYSSLATTTSAAPSPTRAWTQACNTTASAPGYCHTRPVPTSTSTLLPTPFAGRLPRRRRAIRLATRPLIRLPILLHLLHQLLPSPTRPSARPHTSRPAPSRQLPPAPCLPSPLPARPRVHGPLPRQVHAPTRCRRASRVAPWASLVRAARLGG